MLLKVLDGQFIVGLEKHLCEYFIHKGAEFRRFLCHGIDERNY